MVTLQKERAWLALPAVECATGNARNLLVADDGLAVEHDVRFFPFSVISNWFHCPTGRSACVRGVTAARTVAGMLGSIR